MIEPCRYAGLLEEKLVFLVDAVGIPVLLSLLVLIFTSGGEDLNKLPSNRIELYEIGIESAVSKRLLPGGRTSTDMLIHDWLRLFNLDRSAMVAAVDVKPGVEGAGAEKKEREHRPTRKAGLSMELSNANELDNTGKKNDASKDKKKAQDSNANKQDKKLLNLDAKEVYEVFRHGSHYLREAAKPEVQRTELNRIELTMPKKLVDTVMMLVNANLKMLLNGRAQSLGLAMLRHVAVSNQLAGRREFSAVHVATALLIDQVNTEGITLWMHLNKEELGLPLTKTLEAQTELAPAQYQFKHLSFQEGLFAQDLLLKAEEGWETWEDDEKAAGFLNNPFMNNTCRIAAGYLGSRLAKRRPAWDFSKPNMRLTEVGLQALWLICEQNEKLKTLHLKHNAVGVRAEDGIGLSRMVSTSSALTTLGLGSNSLGELKGYLRLVGRGLSSNKTLTFLDVSNNRLLPDGIKVLCNALRTCTGLKYLDLSFNSPGRELALSQMLQVHPTLRSFGVIEKEPTTRSEKTWWLDTRAKEAIGKALLSSKSCTIMYCQCDVFSLTETTESLNWTSKANCDAIVLAGVLRSNSVLKTLNVLASDGEIGDYEREEIGNALIANKSGKVGYSDLYNLTEGMSPTHRVDLKDKEHIRSKKSFNLFAGLLRANQTLTNLTLANVGPDHSEVLADALATNRTLKLLILEQPSKSAPTAYASLPVQELNGALEVTSIDLFNAGGDQPVHKNACGVVGALLGAAMGANLTIHTLKINPGGGSDGGAILEHLHRARRSSLKVLDLANINLGDRGGGRFFESMLGGRCPMLTSLHLGSNQLTDAAIGQLMVEVMRADTCGITTLDLRDNLLSVISIAQTIKYNKSLTSLVISGNPIEDDGLRQLGGLLLEPNCTCCINSISCAAFDIIHGSDQIVMHNDLLDEGAARLLFGVLKYNKLITTLNLGGRGIQTDAASILAKAISHNSTLKSVDLSDNPLSDVSQYTRAKDPSDTKGLLALAKAVQASTSIHSVTLEGGTLPVDQLKGDKKVRVLDLSRKALGFISAIFIGTLLSANTYMNEFIVHTNDLSPSGVTNIVKQLPSNIKALDMSNCVRLEERSKGDKKVEKKVASSTEIPPERLAEMWYAITELVWLEKLTLDRDHLSELPYVGKLLNLKSLSISNNKLTLLPDDIGLIDGLKTLILHGNQLIELNSAVGELENLEKIDLRSNKLAYLTPTVSQLRNLKYLDVSENMIQSLDPSIGDLHFAEKCEFNTNPLVNPPAAVARQGVPAIRKHFQEIVTSANIQTYRAHMVLIGHAGSGKTQLQTSLRKHAAGLKLTKPPPYESTNHLTVEAVALGEGARRVMLSIWDLTGAPEHASGIQQYLAPGSIFLLAVPAMSLAQLTNGYEEYIGRWLDYLKLQAPNAIVLPVMTKCDLAAAKSEERVPDRLQPEKLAADAAAQVGWFTEQLDAFEASQARNEPSKSLRIQRPVRCVATGLGGEPCMDALKGVLEGILFAENKLLPQVGTTVTRDVFLTSTFIRALRDGRDPIDSARAADIGYIPANMSTDQVPTRPHMAFAAMFALYSADFAPALKLPSSEETLRDTLKLMADCGEVLIGPNDLIFLKISYLPRILKPLTDPMMGNRLWLSRTLAVKEAIQSTRFPGAAPISEFKKNEIGVASEWFEKTGEIRDELLVTLWDPQNVRQDDYREVISFLCAAGLVYLSENTQHGRRWKMPSRTPDQPVNEAKQEWADALEAQGGTADVLTATLALGSVLPAHLLDTLISSCGGLGSWVSTWKNGGRLKSHALPDVAGLLVEVCEVAAGEGTEGSPAKTAQRTYELRIECAGKKDTRLSTWQALMFVKKLAQRAADEVPGLGNCRSVLICPGCKAAPRTTWALEDLTVRSRTCANDCDSNSSAYAPSRALQTRPLSNLCSIPAACTGARLAVK